MKTIRNHTTIEQSKRLIELGLEPYQADMRYFSDGYNQGKVEIGFDEETRLFYKSTQMEYIPLFSFTNLMNFLPNNHVALLREGNMYRIEIKDLFMTSLFELPVDAVFAIVEYLLQFKKEILKLNG